jgi:hypothetical protein
VVYCLRTVRHRVFYLAKKRGGHGHIITSKKTGIPGTGKAKKHRRRKDFKFHNQYFRKRTKFKEESDSSDDGDEDNNNDHDDNDNDEAWEDESTAESSNDEDSESCWSSNRRKLNRGTKAGKGGAAKSSHKVSPWHGDIFRCLRAAGLV